MKRFAASLIVASGSALGAILRYLAGLPASGANWPWDTLLVNTSGALAIGILTALTARAAATNRLLAWRLFLMPGLLGGYTTFSVFSLESLILLQSHHNMLFIFNISANMAGALIAVWLGHASVRRLGASPPQ